MSTEQRKFEKWERTRSKGKWNFIIKYGVVFWGLLTAVLCSLFISLVLRKASFFEILPLSLVLFPIGGIAWGLAMWNYTEKIYHKQKTINDTPHSNS